MVMFSCNNSQWWLSVSFLSILVLPDFDDDGTLDSGDLKNLVNCLTGETNDTRLTEDEMRQLIKNVSSLGLPLMLRGTMDYNWMCVVPEL